MEPFWCFVIHICKSKYMETTYVRLPAEFFTVYAPPPSVGLLKSSSSQQPKQPMILSPKVAPSCLKIVLASV